MQDTSMGLDVGTSRVVLATKSGNDYNFASQLNAFVRIPYSKITEGVLRKEGVPFTVGTGELVVHGNESERFADLLGKEMRRPMRGGVLNPSEPDSENQMALILKALLGDGKGKGQRMCFSVPAPPVGSD